MTFIHLHRHSEFSRLDGLGTARQYAAQAAALGQPGLALTDHGTGSGLLHHIVACSGKEKGERVHDAVIPICGVEAYFRPSRLLAPKMKLRQAWHLCLYAKNLTGWHNLLRIISTAFQDPTIGGGFYQYPCVDWELLRRHRGGMACSSACISSWLSNLISGGDSIAVTDYIDQMLSIYGDDFYIEIMPHDFEEQRQLNLELISIAMNRSIPLVATNDAHFPYAEWASTQRIAKLCGSQSSLKKAEEDKAKGKADYLAEIHPTLYLSSEQEMFSWFADFHPQIGEQIVEEAIANTGLFMRKMTPFMLDKTDKLPRIAQDEQHGVQLFSEWIEEGLERIFSTYPAEHWERWPKQLYRDRVQTELAILKTKGVIDYFLLVGDVVRWAKSQGIRVGLGRGSAAGCLISYLIGITAIDPIPWGLLFERFLNPTRKGLPDIDIDFQGDRRGDVKAYLARKHGQEHVADIITHARFQPKSVIQALCRAHDVPYTEAHALTNTIEIRQDSEETTLEELLPINPKLGEFKEKWPEIWEHALRMEGTVQNAGKHAAGIIITPRPVTDYMALERGKSGDLVTSWSDAADFPVVSDHGFVKIDALGIVGLTKHGYTCKLIKQRHGIDVDLYSLPPLRNPYDVEEDVLEGFRKGWTIGIFQFGGKGITDLLRQIQPSGSALDLAAANALYRPGPMKGGVTWDYAKRKHREYEWNHWHELVEPILSETYGVIAYQEQVMEISKQLGGFPGGMADDMRKAMGKLYRIKGGTEARRFMRQFEQTWFEGCAARKISRKIADEIWHKLLQFGSYGFNKSHSASYALTAYQDMWLKIHYPLEFYAAFLSYEDDEDKQMAAIREARSRGFEILPPSVNTSNVSWTVDGDKLRMGLVAIKGVGDKGASAIIVERSRGDYESLDDFRARVSLRAINARSWEALHESGAFDCFGVRDGVDPKIIAKWEKERLKLSLTVPSAAEQHADFLRENIFTQDEVALLPAGSEVSIGGEITKVEHKSTKKGNPFANVTISFEMNTWRVKFWTDSLMTYGGFLEEGNCIMVAGVTDNWNGFISVVAKFCTDDMDKLKEQELAGTS